MKKGKDDCPRCVPVVFSAPVTDTRTLDRLGAKRDKHGSANLFVPKTTSRGYNTGPHARRVRARDEVDNSPASHSNDVRSKQPSRNPARERAGATLAAWRSGRKPIQADRNPSRSFTNSSLNPPESFTNLRLNPSSAAFTNLSLNPLRSLTFD